MPSCPKCKRKISCLTMHGCAHITEYRTYTVSLDDDKEIEHNYSSTDDSDTKDEEYTYEYYCPECNKKLFSNEEEVKDFLNPNVLSLIKKSGLE